MTSCKNLDESLEKREKKKILTNKKRVVSPLERKNASGGKKIPQNGKHKIMGVGVKRLLKGGVRSISQEVENGVIETIAFHWRSQWRSLHDKGRRLFYEIYEGDPATLSVEKESQGWGASTLGKKKNKVGETRKERRKSV